eukprot:CAMPEP_0113882346 /NCGR_PEP_ID=MMETSP0780_2-20120614/8904_1 /TAXON_ID=652834 /ORGANISM="Palpitomonas bilix" /LENGTH=328 /DNA_ID=CAMNT_0000869351 /DNA_START=53 /DNA_END=1039 /DNA_ORIENTATION=+ /assembly_acc=CAM_ASM_000599
MTGGAVDLELQDGGSFEEEARRVVEGPRLARAFGTTKAAVGVIVALALLTSALVGVSVLAGVQAEHIRPLPYRPASSVVAAAGPQNLKNAVWETSNYQKKASPANTYENSVNLQFPGAFENTAQSVSVKTEALCISEVCGIDEVCTACTALAGTAGTSSANSDAPSANDVVKVTTTTSTTGTWSPSFDCDVTWNMSYSSYVESVYSSQWKEAIPPSSTSLTTIITNILNAITADKHESGAHTSATSSVHTRTSAGEGSNVVVAGSGVFRLRYRVDDTSSASNLPADEVTAVESAPCPLCYIEIYGNSDASAEMAIAPSPLVHCTLVVE